MFAGFEQSLFATATSALHTPLLHGDAPDPGGDTGCPQAWSASTAPTKIIATLGAIFMSSV
jgi:hypothetical protein